MEPKDLDELKDIINYEKKKAFISGMIVGRLQRVKEIDISSSESLPPFLFTNLDIGVQARLLESAPYLAVKFIDDIMLEYDLELYDIKDFNIIEKMCKKT